MWKEGQNSGFAESDKIAHLIVPYTRGHVLDLGAGNKKTWPHFTMVDNCVAMGGKNEGGADVVQNCKELKLFGTKSWDAVFSSHLLEHFAPEDVPSILNEWARVLRVGGYLVLYVPSGNLYPKAFTPGANDDHKWDIYPGDIEKLLRANTTCGWTQLEKEERNQGEEYSLYLVFKKRDDGKFVEQIWERYPEGKKRALIVRFGAIGDLLQSSSILPGLKEQGYHITWMGHADNASILKNNPYIDSWILQDKDQVPNYQLGSYWESIKERYDKNINLCESIEGGLLQMPGRLQHMYAPEARRRIFGTVNYLDRTHDIAAVPRNPQPKFFPTDLEKAWAKKEREKIAGPVIIWCLTGTSHHKTYPYVDTILKWITAKTPATVYLYGDKHVAKVLEDAIMECLKKDGINTSQIKQICGKWSIRESLTFAQIADIVIGPETGIMNGVSHEDAVHKIVYLSHSSHENLTRDWTNTKVIVPSTEKCPCYPCHQLHYQWEFCHKVEETGAALCATSITPEEIFSAVMEELKRMVEKLEAAE